MYVTNKHTVTRITLYDPHCPKKYCPNKHYPKTLSKEIRKMPADIPIYIGHLKPQYQKELIQEIKDLDEDNLHILDQDGLIFNFD